MQKQQGFSLLLLLTLLVAAGGFAMVELSTTLRSNRSLASAVLNNSTLAQARQALISYAAHYPYLYGAQGAGVGHLPCPDTDSLHTSVMGWSVNQGPNPPCGKSAVAIGHLPSHISFSNERYMIHAGFGSRVEYSVSAQVINNPSLHAVNPALTIGSPLEQHTVAKLQQQVPAWGSKATQSNEVMISEAALLLAIRPSVAYWFAERNRYQNFLCVDNESVEPQQQDVRETHQRCVQFRQLIAKCSTTGLSVERFQLTNLQFHLLMLYLADDIPEDYLCEQSALAQTTIDNVPANKHWFIRNGWLEWIIIEHDDQCTQLTEAVCTLTYVNRGAHESVPNPLFFRWVIGV